jgi:DNA-binding ferritin-like protein
MATTAELDKELDALAKEFRDAVDAIDKRIVALGERVVSLENATTPDYTAQIAELATKVAAISEAVARLDHAPAADLSGFKVLADAVNDLHVRIMGVPLGTVQSLSDGKDDR